MRLYGSRWAMSDRRLGAWFEFEPGDVSLVLWGLWFGVRLAMLWFPKCPTCNDADCRGCSGRRQSEPEGA